MKAVSYNAIPCGDTHVFEYDAVDQETGYHPPELSGQPTPTRYRYNLDKDLTQVNRPDGQTVSLGYTSGGELDNLNLARGQYRYSYHPTTGQLTDITAPDGGTLGFTWDGFLPLSTTWNGEINGTVSQSYDNNFWITGRSVNGQNIAFGYDNDGLLTSAGSMSLSRNAANGLLTDTALGNVTTGHQHNTFGEPIASTTTIGSNDAVQMSYTRDKLGRITSKTEEVNGQTIEDSYEYDLAGRLVSMIRNGQTTTWTYDANGNRTHINGQPVAGYDEQDRLVSYQGASYEYTENGELKSKIENGATTAYDYDELGNLLQVTLPGDLTIDYLIDGNNRRIGKKVNGTLTQGFLYQDQLNPVAELDGSGNVIARFIYADKTNVPAYMVKEGKTYRIISNHLGSPRLIVDTASGEIAQRISYDVWGNITEDTNPGFQPFGFAGGIYDQQTKLIRFGARDYDAETARWTSKDPIRFGGGDANLYGYVENDPITYFDPLGLKLWYADKASEAAMKPHITEIMKTSDGRKLLKQLNDSATVYKIHEGQGPYGPAYYDPSTNEVYIDTTFAPTIQTNMGPKSASTTRILAHELGHCTGSKDDGPNNMNNVNAFENPIMGPLEGYLRSQY